MQMQSISGIITQVRSTSGEVPPPLVGASVTVVGDRVFVFAGRLVSSRKMTNHLRVLDLKTLEWTRHIPPPNSDKPPKPRYFHSANVYNNSIVYFGGMGYSRVSADGLCVLDDVAVFDITTMCWQRPEINPSLFAPRPRYAHLASIAEDKLIVIGGQDMNNNYLGEINILDLKTWEWVQVKNFDKHVGAYRSVAVTTPPGTRLPMMLKDSMGEEPFNITDTEGEHGKESSAQGAGAGGVVTNHRASLVRQYGQSLQGPQDPSPIYLYTNYNFADVKRELQLIFSPASVTSSIEDCSNYMSGSVMPPGLRFPTGHTLGHHLILAGTYLSPQSQAYVIWSLNLGTLTWARIETGSVFTSGSWNKGVLHEDTNRLLVFGNRTRNLLEDYNHRQVNFDHIASVDLEAFGVYKLPRTTCSSLAQEMGLSLLNEPSVSDFRIISRENHAINVNSAVLCQRWPYFAEMMKENREHVRVQPEKEDRPSEPPSAIAPNEEPDDKEETPTGEDDAPNDDTQATKTTIKCHSMVFPYPHSVIVALLQFIYTDSLLTAQQYQPHILSQLLLLADMYNLPRLRELATHALHQMLNMSTAPLIFEAAALAHQTSLQIRALKMMIAAKKMIQQQMSGTVSRQRTQSTPSDALRDQPQVSPTLSLSSSGFNTMSHSQRHHLPPSPQHNALDSRIPSTPYDPGSNSSSNAASPILSGYRTRTPSLTNRSTFSITDGAGRSSSAGMMPPYGMGPMRSGSTSYSPPSTPHHAPMALAGILDSDTASITSPPAEQPSSSTKKEKTKKKKNFLEAFGNKFSMS